MRQYFKIKLKTTENEWYHENNISKNTNDCMSNETKELGKINIIN